MSINPFSHVSQIWSRATTALSGTPDSGSAMARSVSPSAKQNRDSHAASPSPSDASSTTPFATLSSSLQSVLLQLQSAQTSDRQGSPGQTHPYTEAPMPASAQTPQPGQPNSGSLSTIA